MQVKYAIFRMVWSRREYQVAFQDGRVVVANDKVQVVTYDNKDAKWKPCATHAEEILRLAFAGEVKTAQAKRRSAKARPALKLFGDR